MNCIAAAFVAASCFQVTASQPTDTAKTYHVDEVVVSAARFPQRAGEIGRSVSLISGELLRYPGTRTVGEVLSMESGIYAPGTGQVPGMIQSLFLRGANSNQTAILIDDIPVTDPSAVNNGLDIGELSMTGIDRIEVVRGSHGTLFGSSAVGGVVALMSRKGGTPGIHLDAVGGGGWYGSGTWLRNEVLDLNYTAPEGWYFNVSAEDLVSAGIDATVDSSAAGEPGRDRDGFHKRNLRVKSGFTNDRWDVYGGLHWTGQKADIDKRAYVDDDNYTIESRRFTATYGAAYTLNDFLGFRWVGGYSAMNRSATDDSSMIRATGFSDRTFVSSENVGGLFTNELHVMVTSDAFTAIGGIGHRRETMNLTNFIFANQFPPVYTQTTDLDSLRLASQNVFGFLYVSLRGGAVASSLERLLLSVGVRRTANERFGTNWVWEVSPVYHPASSWQVYGLLATGFNAPSLYQLYNPVVFGQGYIVPGNASLKPERSVSAELGVRFDDHEGTRCSVSLARTTVRDAITYVYLWNKSIGIDTLANDWMRDDFRGDTYLNVGTQSATTLEFDADQRVTSEVTMSLNLSLLTGWIDYSPDGIDETKTQGHHIQLFDNGQFLRSSVRSKGLPRRPTTMNGSISYRPSRNYSLRIDVRFAGKRNDVVFDSHIAPYGALAGSEVEAYTLVDVSQRWQFDAAWTVQLKIENLADRKFSEIKGFSTRGRGFFASLGYEF